MVEKFLSEVILFINMLITKKYESLESNILNSEATSIVFQPEENIELMLGVSEGKHVINIEMPWNNTFEIGKYTSEQEARKEYDKYLTQLKQRYGIHITSNRTAELIKPK